MCYAGSVVDKGEAKAQYTHRHTTHTLTHVYTYVHTVHIWQCASRVLGRPAGFLNALRPKTVPFVTFGSQEPTLGLVHM